MLSWELKDLGVEVQVCLYHEVTGIKGHNTRLNCEDVGRDC